MDKSQLLFNLQNNTYDVLLPPFQQIANSLAAKQTYSIPIPVDQCYWYLSLQMTATMTVAMIQELRVKINGVLAYQISGTQLDKINQYYRSPASTAATVGTILIVPFVREGSRGQFGGLQMVGSAGSQVQSLIDPGIPQAETETALNTGSPDSNGNMISQVVLELDMVNTPAAGSLIITPKAKCSPKVPGGPGAILFVNTSTYTSSISTTNIMTQNNGLLYGDINHSFIDSFFIFPPAGTVDNFQFWLNGQEIFQRTANENTFWQTYFNCRTPIAGVVAIDFCESGFNDQYKYVAPVSTACRFQFSDSAAEGTPVVQRSVGYLF